jgi:hypothetical protein
MHTDVIIVRKDHWKKTLLELLVSLNPKCIKGSALKVGHRYSKSGVQNPYICIKSGIKNVFSCKW